jgi:hypothetical protein
VPSNFYKFEKHEMTNFNIPPPSNQYRGNLTASQGFFQGKKKGAPEGLSLDWAQVNPGRKNGR